MRGPRRSLRSLSPAEHEEVLEVLHSKRFVNQAPATVVATLMDEGRYLCSVRTIYRILAQTLSAASVAARRPTRPHNR